MKKGFTLVELLAVIVILSIIAIITIPMISNVIEKSKLGAMEDSAYGLIEAANYYYAEHMNEMSSNKLFIIENGTQTSEEKLNYKGKIEGNAKVLLASNGKVALCLTNGKSYAKKEITDSKVVMNTVSSDTTCEINGLESCSDITIDISGSNSSYYNKNEIDVKLNDIRNDLSNYATKDEFNTLSSTVSSNKEAIDNLNSSLGSKINGLVYTRSWGIGDFQKSFIVKIKPISSNNNSVIYAMIWAGGLPIEIYLAINSNETGITSLSSGYYRYGNVDGTLSGSVDNGVLTVSGLPGNNWYYAYGFAISNIEILEMH